MICFVKMTTTKNKFSLRLYCWRCRIHLQQQQYTLFISFFFAINMKRTSISSNNHKFHSNAWPPSCSCNVTVLRAQAWRCAGTVARWRHRLALQTPQHNETTDVFYIKRIYRAAVSQRLRNPALQDNRSHFWFVYNCGKPLGLYKQDDWLSKHFFNQCIPSPFFSRQQCVSRSVGFAIWNLRSVVTIRYARLPNWCGHFCF